MFDLELFKNTENTLTSLESDLLNECELTIQKGVETFEATWVALMEIRDSKLYRAEFKTFEDYCQIRWGMGRRYANMQIQAGQVLNNLGTRVPKLGVKQLTPMSGLEEETQREVVKQAFEVSDKPTAKIIQEIVNKSGGLNEILKELKLDPELIFNSESEMIEKAKSLITMPEPQVIEVEVIKEVIIDNSAQLNLLESQNKQLEQSLLKKDSLLKEATNKIDSIPALENKIQELTNTKSVDMDLEKLLETKEILKKEIEYDRENLGLKDLLLTAKAKFNNAMQEIILVKSDVDYSLLNTHAQDLSNLVQQWLINFQNIYILKH